MTGQQPGRIARRYAVYLAVVTAAVLIADVRDVVPAAPTQLQAVGLPPLDLFHDLRLLLAYAPSQWLFWPALAMMLLFRAAALAWVLAGAHRAGWVAHLRRTLLFYAVATPPLLVGAAAAFASGATLFYLLFWIGLLIAVVVFLLLAPVPWTGQWWFWRHGRRSWCALGYLGLLVLAGVAYGVLPVLGLLGAGALTVGTAYVLVTGRWPVLQFSVGAVTGALVLVLLVALWASPDVSDYRQPPEQQSAAARGSLLLVGGIDSSTGVGAVFDVDPRALGFTCEQTHYFSYAGPGGGVPDADAACHVRSGARYSGEHTYRSVAELAPELAAQVAQVPKPVTVVAHSQGVWVVHRALTAEPRPDIAAVAYLGALPTAGVTYSDAGGPGTVGRQLLELVSGPLNRAGLTQYRPDQPLAMELLANPEQLSQLFRRPVPPGTRSVVLASLFDLPLAGAPEVANARAACSVSALHPALSFHPDVHEQVRALVASQSAPSCTSAAGLVLALRQFGTVPNHAG